MVIEGRGWLRGQGVVIGGRGGCRGSHCSGDISHLQPLLSICLQNPHGR